jgi:hypothetical protein
LLRIGADASSSGGRESAGRWGSGKPAMIVCLGATGRRHQHRLAAGFLRLVALLSSVAARMLPETHRRDLQGRAPEPDPADASVPAT